MKKLFAITIGLGILFLMGCQKATITPETPIDEATGAIEATTGVALQSFEECVNAGFPIMESYPRQCNDGLATHTEILSGNQITGEIIEQQNQELSWEETKPQESTGTNLSMLQQKLRAMMERRNQQTTPPSPVQTSPTTVTPQTTVTTSWDEKVTEQDIENLEKIIDEIIKK